MIYQAYKTLRFGEDQLEKIQTALDIITEFADDGYDLTLRQLYYQFVSRGLIENIHTEYDNLGKTISRGRLAGLLPWDTIVDRTRDSISNATWDGPGARIRSAARSYAIDCWADQDNRVEVWIEKEALIGVITDTCRNEDVTHFACKGYVSQSEMWAAAQRLLGYSRNGQDTYIIHLGDHDPSGIDMTRDIEDRLEVFMGDRRPCVYRIALNMDQIEAYNPPPNPTKLSDGRAKKYIAEHGSSSWELDALKPATIVDLVRQQIRELRDHKLWNAKLAEEKAGRERLEFIADNWGDIDKLIPTKGDEDA